MTVPDPVQVALTAQEETYPLGLTAQEEMYPLGLTAQEETYPLGVSFVVVPEISSATLFLGASEKGISQITSDELDAMNIGHALTHTLVLEEEAYIYVGFPATETLVSLTNLDTGQALLMSWGEISSMPFWPSDRSRYSFKATWNKMPAGTYRLEIETRRKT